MARQRLILAMVGALAGGSLYLLFRMVSEGGLNQTVAMAAMVFVGVLFTSLLALTGPMELPRALGRAGLQAGIVAALIFWASLRFNAVDDVATSPIIVASGLILTFIPLPFILAEDGLGWRNYPALFMAAWGIVMRSTVAWVFVGILWLVIYLSHALLSLVGIDVISQIILMPPVPWLITGTAFGLAMAVALELSEVMSAYLVLRLLRLLVPVILVVMAVFLVAVGLNGFGRLQGVSASAILLAMVGLAATLVTSAVDQDDEDAVQTLAMQRATQGLAAILILQAGVASWGIVVRVLDHGWTPERLFASTVAVLALGYGVTYLYAVARGRAWMERIRQANIWMAVALMALAVLWLTPVLNPERISVNSQMARFESGKTPLAEFDVYSLFQWGRAGAAAKVVLAETAKSDPALATVMASPEYAASPATVDAEAMRAALKIALPVQPASGSGVRDQLLARASDYDLQSWTAACAVTLDVGGPACVLVVADFLPDRPGQEALLLLGSEGGYVTYLGYALDGGTLTSLSVDSGSGALANDEDGLRLIAELQAAMPGLRPVPRNELAMPASGAISLKP